MKKRKTKSVVRLKFSSFSLFTRCSKVKDEHVDKKQNKTSEHNQLEKSALVKNKKLKYIRRQRKTKIKKKIYKQSENVRGRQSQRKKDKTLLMPGKPQHDLIKR